MFVPLLFLHFRSVKSAETSHSLSVVSRLLGHSSTDITEKVYARFLPETLSSEVERLSPTISSLTLTL